MLSILNFVLKTWLFTELISSTAYCLAEVTSLAVPHHSEASSLVGTHPPEVTRGLVTMKFCYCGGTYERGRCQRQNCPRARLGYGSWHVALPKLQEMWSRDELADQYPDLNLSDLQDHVRRTGQEREEKRRDRDWEHRNRGRQQDRGRPQERGVQNEHERRPPGQ